jgi:hypothetical protein
MVLDADNQLHKCVFFYLIQLCALANVSPPTFGRSHESHFDGVSIPEQEESTSKLVLYTEHRIRLRLWLCFYGYASFVGSILFVC